jgi:hypothetical protein
VPVLREGERKCSKTECSKIELFVGLADYCQRQENYLAYSGREVRLLKKFRPMKIPTIEPRSLSLLLVLTALSGSAQVAGTPAGLGGSLTKLFGDNKAFTAKAEARLLDKAQNETMRMPMDFVLLDDNIRIEIDMAQMKGKKLIYVIYPDQKSLLSMPMPKADAEAATKSPNIQKTALGKETIEGHACVKNKVAITDDQGQTMEATTWNATDMKDFPIQIQTAEKDNISIVLFKDVQLARPDAKQFEPPAGYAQYTDQAEMMQGIIKKMMGGGEGK